MLIQNVVFLIPDFCKFKSNFFLEMKLLIISGSFPTVIQRMIPEFLYCTLLLFYNVLGWQHTNACYLVVRHDWFICCPLLSSLPMDAPYFFNFIPMQIIFGNRWRHLLGERDLWEHVGGIDVSLAPSSFGQANTRVHIQSRARFIFSFFI